MNFSAHWPDRLAGIGDIDILGDRKPISYLRQAVFGIGHAPSIGVLRMDKAGIEVGKTPWMWKDNLASWTWPGYEGETASVDVYANADEVELFLNGESLGRKSIGGVYVVYDAYMNDVRAKGEEMIEQARREGRRIIVLVGRPYHVDPEIGRGNILSYFICC